VLQTSGYICVLELAAEQADLVVVVDSAVVKAEAVVEEDPAVAAELLREFISL
jgi:hypothetical protein